MPRTANISGTPFQRLMLRFPKDLHAALMEEADRQGTTANTLALVLIAGGLGFARNDDVWEHLARHEAYLQAEMAERQQKRDREAELEEIRRQTLHEAADAIRKRRKTGKQ